MSTKLFSVLPMTQSISIDPGSTYTGSITVAIPNDATEDFEYSVSVTPYSVVGENYDADITSNNPRSEIANWITIENPTGTIAPNGTQKIKFTINVPEKASPGGQYAAIVVSSSPNKTVASGASIDNLFQLASIVYASVSGEVIRGGSVLENIIPSFSFSPDIKTSAIVENKGNTHQDAVIAVTVTNALTGDTIYPADKTTEGYFSEVVMPDTTRYITEEIPNIPMIGLIKVHQTVYFNDIAYDAEKELLICPLWFMFLVVFAITSVIFAIVFHIRQRRKKMTII